MCYIISYFQSFLPIEILDRMPNYSQLEFKLGGIKTLMHIISVLIIVKVLNVNKYLFIWTELFVYLILFLLTTLLSNLFNRALIISSILLIAERT